MQCASFTVIPTNPLVYTRQQMAFFAPTWTRADTKGARFDFCRYCHPQRTHLILQQWNQWRNSKLCRSRSSLQVGLATSEIIWNLRLLTAHGHIVHGTESIFLTSFGLPVSVIRIVFTPKNKPFEMVLLTPECEIKTTKNTKIKHNYAKWNTQNVSTWGWCGYVERRKEFVN